MKRNNLIKILTAIFLTLLLLGLCACNANEQEEFESQSSVEQSEQESNTGLDTEPEDTTQNSSDIETETDGKTDTNTCTNHPYAANPNGHWKPACDICGKGEGRMLSHEFVEFSEDEGDLIMYSSYCKVCDYVAYEQEVPYEINLFYSAGELVRSVTQNYKATFGYDKGVCFSAYASEVGGGVISVAQKGEVSERAGKIMVMKIRVPKSQNTVSLTVKSKASALEHTINMDYLDSGWLTLIIDLSKAVSTYTETDPLTGEVSEIPYGYTPDAVGDYYLDQCSVGCKSGSGDESFDVAYIFFCDSLEIARGFAENEKNIYVYEDVMNAEATIYETPCYDANGNVITHSIERDANGHTILSSCDQCGLSTVENEPHVFVQVRNGNSMTYACKICGELQFGANISKYLSAAEINKGACTYYRITTLEETLFDGDTEYAHFSGQGNTAQIIFARSSSVSTPAEKSSGFGVGSAGFLVIKMRTNSPEVSFALKVKTALGIENTLRIPTAVVASGEWAVYVADLRNLIPEAYVAYSNGKYSITDFYLHIGSTDFVSNVEYDVSYIAFFDSWTDMASFVKEDDVINVNGDNAGSLVDRVTRICKAGHNLTTQIINEKYCLICSVCGHRYKEYDISDKVEAFLPAEQLVGFQSIHGTNDRTLKNDENGLSFVRIDNFKTSALNWGGWTVISDSNSTVSGRYMVMKFRIGANGLSQSALEFYIGTENKLDAGMLLSLSVSEDNEWHVIVVDLEERIANSDAFFNPDTDGAYRIRYLQIRPFSKKQTIVQPDDYMDISYIAFCDNINDIREIIDEPTYEWSVDANSNSIRYTQGDACATHTYTETVSGDKHTVKCSVCQTVIREFYVNEAVNWYVNFSEVSIYQHSFEKYREENGIFHTRFTGSGGNEIYLTYDPATSKNISSEKIDTGRYFVIKYRGESSDKRLTLSLQFATGTNSRQELGIQPYASIPHGEWRVAVFDLSQCSSYAIGSTEPINIMLRVGGSPANYVVDVAYAAIVDNTDELKHLLDDNEVYYDYGGSFSSSGTVKNTNK